MVYWRLRIAIRIGLTLGLIVAVVPDLGAADAAVDFGRQIVPLLRERCFRCHEGRQSRAGVRLDLRAELIGETGRDPLVIAGKSAQSRLIAVVSGRDPATKMPPEGPALTPGEVDSLARWIDSGMTWDANLLPDKEGGRQHWAFQPIRRPVVPIMADDTWSRTPVDRFIVAAQRDRRVTPAAEASRRVVARRLFLDLWGLPPTWDDVRQFVADERPDAVDQLIERLLADPRYGERWGRHWLDLARWAESEGFESNHPRPFAWRYRDYVVQAVSADKPFDQFIRQQIAGDELAQYSDENLIATGFLAAARISSNEEDKWLQRNDVTVDVVNTVGSAFLGLTLHCAQCHDHKFDPIGAQDYYALHAFFARGLPLNVALQDPRLQQEFERNARPEYEQAVALQRTLLEQGRQSFIADTRSRLTAEERRIYDTPADRRTAAEELQARQIDLRFQKTSGEFERRIDPASRPLYDALKKRIDQLTPQVPRVPQTFAFYSPVTSPHRLNVLPSQGFYPLPYDPAEMARQKTYVMPRGEVHQIGKDVQPAFPEILSDSASGSVPRTRRDLADWLAHRDQPLVPRVWVNRVWQYHFGRGLVATADDFGIRGSRPTHPELLDWLAAVFLEHGGSTRHLHRLILNSAVYRQSTHAAPGIVVRDPENRWLTRWTPRRLEAEAIRDAWLCASGELDLTRGGPSVPLDQRETSLRRSLYLFQRRGQAPDAQRLFDGPQECSTSVARREVSTSPLQSLYLLNSDFSIRRARALAERLRGAGTEPSALIQAAFHQILVRDPDTEELAAALELWYASSGQAPLESLCQALLNLNEFNYRE